MTSENPHRREVEVAPGQKVEVIGKDTKRHEEVEIKRLGGAQTRANPNIIDKRSGNGEQS